MSAAFIGLDLAKSVFSVHGVDGHGKVVVAKRLRRDAVLAFFANLAPCVVGMEACAGSHFWAREITRLGHTVRLIVDRRPSSGHGRTTPTALIHPANPLQEVAFYRRRWRAILRALLPRKISSL